MENINLIRKIAWSFHRTTGAEWDDLFQEAAMAYCEALKTYNPKKGKVTTYVWWCITSHLKNHLKLEQKQKGHIFLMEEMMAESIAAVNNYETLSKDAQKIAKIIFQNPVKYSLMTPISARKELARLMYQKERWEWNRVRTGLRELRMAYTD